VRRRGPKAALSEAENHPRGASVLLARRRLARGGVRPSSEVETPRRGARSSSETEIRPRGTAADRLLGYRGFLFCGPFFVPGRGHAERVCDSRACLFKFYYFSKWVFSLVIRGPLWLSPTVLQDKQKTKTTNTHVTRPGYMTSGVRLFYSSS
jgi:hypothetical protein